LGNQGTDAYVEQKYPDAETAHNAEGPNTFDRVYKNPSQDGMEWRD
jgi:hypothetical protein